MNEYTWKLIIKPKRGLKYNPGQPRVPAGDSRGGQWTSGNDGGTSGVVSFAELSKAERDDLIDNLTPDTNLQLFHGTRDPDTVIRIIDEGFDPSQRPQSGRIYQGKLAPETGFYVSPWKLVSSSFGRYVIEFNSPAEKLVSPPQKGLGDESPDDFWRSTFPNSFRPGLSRTLKGGESQGLLVKKVPKHDVKSIWLWDGSKGEWTPLGPEQFKQNYDQGAYKSVVPRV